MAVSAVYPRIRCEASQYARRTVLVGQGGSGFMDDLQFVTAHLVPENPSPLKLVLKPDNRSSCDLISQAVGKRRTRSAYHGRASAWISSI